MFYRVDRGLWGVSVAALMGACATVLVAACATITTDLRPVVSNKAAFDLACEPNKLVITELGDTSQSNMAGTNTSKSFGVDGCGKRASYNAWCVKGIGATEMCDAVQTSAPIASPYPPASPYPAPLYPASPAASSTASTAVAPVSPASSADVPAVQPTLRECAPGPLGRRDRRLGNCR